MKTAYFLIIFCLVAFYHHTKACAAPISDAVPIQIHFKMDDAQPAHKKPNKTKKADDKLRRHKKPADQNKSKRAEEQKIIVPKTIIVV